MISGFKSLIRQSETPLVEVILLIPYSISSRIIWYVKILADQKLLKIYGCLLMPYK